MKILDFPTWSLVDFDVWVSHSFFASYGDLQTQKGPHSFLDNIVPLILELVIKAMLVMASTTDGITKDANFILLLGGEDRDPLLSQKELFNP